MLQGFSWYLPADGGHWHRVVERAAEFGDLGITAVWLPPAYKGASGADDVGYGVYDLYDLGEFDQKGSVRTKYGTKSQYLACTRALHDAGAKVIADIVLNQRMGADECEIVRARSVSRENRMQITSDWQDIGAWTKFTFPGRGGAYSDFVWDWHCFHGVDYNARNSDGSIFLFEGKQWDNSVNHEFGNFDYLMGCDVDLLYPPVYEELVQWGVWYIQEADIDGLRLDAIKHMSRDFYLRWLHDVRERSGKDLFAVGEYWESGLDELRGYLGAERTMSLFDVFLHFKLHDASLSNGNFDLSRLFDGTLVQAEPNLAVTFVDNHDTQDGQSLQSSVAGWFKPSAYALILLRQEGYPCVFYGDLYGTDRVQKVDGLDRLLRVRKHLAYGAQHDWLDDPDVVGWTREGSDSYPLSGCAVMMSDRAEGRKRMYVGETHANETWSCVHGGMGDVVIGSDGWADFVVPGGGLSVFVNERAAQEIL